MEKTKQPTLEQFLKKIEAFKEKNGVDLATTEDLSIAVMNLISLEEHFFFTGAKTGKDEYFEAVQEIRSERKKLLAELMPNNEGETWCIAKHLLAATMRLIEVGNKLRSEGEKEKAKEKFEQAYRIYSIFWGVKLGLVNVQKGGTSSSKSSELEDLVKKLADCCNE